MLAPLPPPVEHHVEASKQVSFLHSPAPHAVKHRVEEEKADWIIYVTDMGQAQHFDLVGGWAGGCWMRGGW